MFRMPKTLDVITLFHLPSSSSSIRIRNLLKNASIRAADSTNDKNHQSPFELNVTETPPTTDQLRSILEYVGGHRSMDLVDGAKNEGDALKKLSENPKRFKPPVTVDWNNGRAVIGDKDADILRLLSQRPS